MEHEVHGATQTGFASLPWHIPTHSPISVSGSTSQHIAPCAQSSMPLAPESTTMHSSPTCFGSGATGEHRVAFHEPLPSFAHGMHFSPTGQSCDHRSHSSSP